MSKQSRAAFKKARKDVQAPVLGLCVNGSDELHEQIYDTFSMDLYQRVGVEEHYDMEHPCVSYLTDGTKLYFFDKSTGGLQIEYVQEKLTKLFSASALTSQKRQDIKQELEESVNRFSEKYVSLSNGMEMPCSVQLLRGWVKAENFKPTQP
jgi:hypothetical protein